MLFQQPHTFCYYCIQVPGLEDIEAGSWKCGGDVEIESRDRDVTVVWVGIMDMEWMHKLTLFYRFIAKTAYQSIACCAEH
jgi:hypothetical protein